MANDDPDNELAHYRLGQLYMEAEQYENAVSSFRRTLELSPHFSKVFHLLGEALIKLDQTDEAIKVLQEGFAVADERGDNLPREEMSKLLVSLGQPVPESKRSPSESVSLGVAGGEGLFCQHAPCPAGMAIRASHTHQLPKPPMQDELGQMIYEKVCAECWNYWLRDMSVKVINEMRLDLSTEKGQETYDQIMKETLGLA